MAIDQQCAALLLCSSYLTDHIRLVCRIDSACLVGRVGGQTSHTFPAMPWNPINHPRRLFGDPPEGKGGPKEKGRLRVFACRMAGNASKDDSYPILP